MNDNKNNIQYSFSHQRWIGKLELQLTYLIREFSETKDKEQIKSCLVVSLNNSSKTKEKLLFHIKILGKSKEFKVEESDKDVKVIHENGNYFVIKMENQNKNGKQN